MQFVNYTPFPALSFGGIDQYAQSFHVVALRQTLTWDETGQLKYADEQMPLCEVDQTFDGSPHGCVRQESDLCQFKPRCDVIVNANAHAPVDARGRPASRFQVRLLVKRPDTQPSAPPPPRGLNPWMAPSPEEMAGWQQAVDTARRTWIPGERLIDKILHVTGERAFVKEGALQRGVESTLTFASLGMLRPSGWRLTEPQAQLVVPLTLERAFGGQSRVDADMPCAAKVSERFRLTPQQLAEHPESDGNPPIAHEAYAPNPLGRGFATEWFLNATNAARVSAPQIEYPQRPITLDDFADSCKGRPPADPTLVAGLGVRPKGHPDRAKLVGRVDRYFVMGDAALPEDFDFAVWNAAWPDQQTDYLQGDEVIGLINLCAADTPGAWRDEHGNVLLRLTLPGDAPYVLVRLESGELALAQLNLDTVYVEPTTRVVTTVFRAMIPKTLSVRSLEARQMPLARWQAAEAVRGHWQSAVEGTYAEPAVSVHG